MRWTGLGVQGPLGRTVADTMLVLSAIAGPDPRVPQSLADPGSAFAPPPAELPRGLRVAWAPDLGGRIPVDKAVRDVLDGVPGVVEELGASVEPACLDLDAADEVFRVFRALQFVVAHGDDVRDRPDQVKESIRWNVARGEELTAADIGRAEVLRGQLYAGAVSFFDDYDVLLAPTTQVVPFDVDTEYPTEVDGVAQPDYISWMRSCTLISATGCPAASVPAGFTPDGLPVGLQVIAAPRADAAVLRVAQAFEQATGWTSRRPEPR